MADDSDVLLRLLDRQWSQAQQAETQRALVTRFGLVVVAALQGFIVHLDFVPITLFLAFLVILIGTFGYVMSAKYYERFRLHLCHAGRINERLDELHPNAQLLATVRKADDLHRTRFPRFHKLRLNSLWNLLQCFMVLVGIVDCLVVYVRLT